MQWGAGSISGGNQEFSHHSQGKVSGHSKPALSPGTRGFYHEGSRESRCLLFIFVNGRKSSSHRDSLRGQVPQQEPSRTPGCRSCGHLSSMPAAPQGAHGEERVGGLRWRWSTEGRRKRRKEVAGPRLRTPLYPSATGARIEQSQFRGGKSVSRLPADLYFLRALQLMKT